MSNDKNKRKLSEVFKDPQGLEEANRKARAVFLMGEGMAIVAGGLLCLLSAMLGLIIFVLLTGVFGYLFITMRKQNKRNFCPKCDTRFDYERDVAWTVTGTETKHHNPSNSNQKSLVSEKVAAVSFTCTCSQCGEKKQFVKKFTIAKKYNDGTLEQKNIEELVANYFKI